MVQTERKAATVYVVDDDPVMRTALERLMRSVGLRAETFPAAAEFLAAPLTRPACLILDIRLPEMDGLELQRRIAGTDRDLPVVVITGEGDEEAHRRALAAGAVSFFHKPVDDEALLDAVYRAIDDDSN